MNCNNTSINRILIFFVMILLLSGCESYKIDSVYSIRNGKWNHKVLEVQLPITQTYNVTMENSIRCYQDNPESTIFVPGLNYFITTSSYSTNVRGRIFIDNFIANVSVKYLDSIVRLLLDLQEEQGVTSIKIFGRTPSELDEYYLAVQSWFNGGDSC